MILTGELLNEGQGPEMKRTTVTKIFMLALLALLTGGCFEKEGWQPTTGDKKRISDNILKAAPAMKYTVTFLAFDKKIDTRASMQLVDYYPLGTIDNKFTTAYHNRHLTKIYRLLSDIIIPRTL